MTSLKARLRAVAGKTKAVAVRVAAVRKWAHAKKATITIATMFVLHVAAQYWTSVPSDTILKVVKALVG